MRARLLIGASVALMAAVLGGCATDAGVPTYTTSLPAATAGADILPLSLIDQTGLVTGIAYAPPSGASSEVIASPDRPEALRVSWLSGECDDRVTLVLADIGGVYQLAIHSHPQFAAGIMCDAGGISRSLDIDFNRHLDPSELTLSIQFP